MAATTANAIYLSSDYLPYYTTTTATITNFTAGNNVFYFPKNTTSSTAGTFVTLGNGVDGSNIRIISPSGTASSGTITITSTNDTIGYSYISNRDIFKARIKSNLLVRVQQRQRYLSNVLPQEQRARDVLRDMLTEQEWRRYVTNGFIMVKGSHFWYQIFATGGVDVYLDGKKIHHICVHTDQKCPPTDHIINMKTLVEIDEEMLWRSGNIRRLA